MTYTYEEALTVHVSDPPRGWLWKVTSSKERPDGWCRWTFTANLTGRTYAPGTRFAPVYERPIDRDAVIELLAGVMAGLAVPNSLGGPRILGTAHQPWEDLYHLAFAIGYPTPEDWADWLRENL